MHLVPCIPPEGVLEPAPGTSLREAAAGEQWDGFWSVDDERFYTRCVSASGERWFRIADIARTQPAARVILFPVARQSPRMFVGRYRGQAMLVGTRPRRPAGAKR